MNFEDQLYNMIGKRIREERLKAKFTQKELAQQIDLTRTSITNIESGQQKIQVHTLYIIAKALGIPVGNLLPEIELKEKAIEEQLPDDLPTDARKWILDIINPTDESRGENHENP